MAEQTLTMRAGALDDAARAAYAALLDPAVDPCGGLQSVDQLLAGAEFFELVNDAGNVVARYALRVEHFAGGIEGQILGAVGNVPGGDLTASVLPLIEQQLVGVDQIVVLTKRLGLVGKLRALGFDVAYALRKSVTDQAARAIAESHVTSCGAAGLEESHG